MRSDAFIGLAGEVVETVSTRTEADPAGLLASFLVGFGAAAGPGPHALADGARHPGRLNVVLVGASSRARKGTSWAVIKNVLSHGDPDLVSHRIVAGIASGEGLVSTLARREPGPDSHVMIVEPEIARLLRTANRSPSLSALMRQAWDGDDLAILTRRRPLIVRGASVALLGHITADELQRRLDATEIANGFANRMLFVWVERARRLPFGSDIPQDELDVLGVRIKNALATARSIDRLEFSPEGREVWGWIYNTIEDDLEGVVGALLARAEAQMLRLAVTYALLDGSALIEPRHLNAARAIWDHSTETVQRVFANTAPDHVAQVLMAALQAAGRSGLDGSQQQALFARHQPAHRIAAARDQLERQGIARTTIEHTGGRPRIRTCILEPAAAGEHHLSSHVSPHATRSLKRSRGE